jgi:hypothetical protein
MPGDHLRLPDAAGPADGTPPQALYPAIVRKLRDLSIQVAAFRRSMLTHLGPMATWPRVRRPSATTRR